MANPVRSSSCGMAAPRTGRKGTASCTPPTGSLPELPPALRKERDAATKEIEVENGPAEVIEVEKAVGFHYEREIVSGDEEVGPNLTESLDAWHAENRRDDPTCRRADPPLSDRAGHVVAQLPEEVRPDARVRRDNVTGTRTDRAFGSKVTLIAWTSQARRGVDRRLPR